MKRGCWNFGSAAFYYFLKKTRLGANSDMTRRDTAKPSLYSITWPIFIEMSLQMLMGTTDVFMLSHVSDEAVAYKSEISV
jgi:Na+-driven multidrug efflux pump